MRRDMILASNSLHNIGGQNRSCHATNSLKWNFLWGLWFHNQIICCNVRLPCRLLVRHLFFCLTCLFSQLWFLWRKKGIFHLKFWIAVSQPYASQIYLEKPYPSRNSIITWAKHNSYIPLFNFDAYFMLEELLELVSK